MKKFVSTVALLGLALAATLPVQAGTFNFAGTLSATDLTYNRTLTGNPPTGLTGVGTAVSFDTYAFTVDLTGLYTLQTLSAAFTTGTPDDTFITLYQTFFNRLTPLVNALQADDDTGAGFLSAISNRTLTAGVNYFLVVTSFSNGQFGNYTGNITGVGNIITEAIPEPFTVAGLFLAAGAGVLAKRKKNA